MLLGASMIFFACKKDEGLTDTDKEKFIKQYGTLAEGVDIKQTADGGFIVLGTTQGSGSVDIYLKKVDAYGTPQWSKSFDAGGGFDESASSIIITNSGGFAIVGSTTEKIGSTDLGSTLLILTDASGNLLPNGMKIYNSGNIQPGKEEHEAGYGLYITNNGEIIVVGERVVDYNNIKVQVGIGRSIDQSTLVEKSEVQAKAPPPTDTATAIHSGFRDVLVTTNGYLVATGYSNFPGPFGTANNSVYLGKLTPNGDAFEGGLTYGSTADDIGNSLIENSSGDIVICGTSAQNTDKDFHVISFDDADMDPDNSLTPKPIWSYTGSHAGKDEAFGITEVSDGYVIVGFTETADNRQMYLEKINSDGSAMLWNKDYGFVDFDEAKAVVATSDNGLAVLGTTSDERGNRVMTLLKLDANGNLR